MGRRTIEDGVVGSTRTGFHHLPLIPPASGQGTPPGQEESHMDHDSILVTSSLRLLVSVPPFPRLKIPVTGYSIPRILLTISMLPRASSMP